MWGRTPKNRVPIHAAYPESQVGTCGSLLTPGHADTGQDWVGCSRGGPRFSGGGTTTHTTNPGNSRVIRQGLNCPQKQELTFFRGKEQDPQLLSVSATVTSMQFRKPTRYTKKQKNAIPAR